MSGPYEPIAELIPLRTLIAMEAMAGLLANSEYWKMMQKDCGHFSPTCLATDAVESADALIAELKT
jgi:hypothetical protein